MITVYDDTSRPDLAPGRQADAAASPASALIAVATAKRDKIKNGGVTVNVGTAAAPINVSASTDADGKADLAGILDAYDKGVLTGDFAWYQSGGTVQLTQAQLQAVSAGVLGFVSSVYAAWQAIVAASTAGTITTVAGVLAPPASVATWPANS